ncbi:CPBP family intramembrane glutamic endopeptidase [Thermococcus sp. AM4]|uniref:CPBP family intramembrane glutamic endopeptidase n=1 Tax=Thermococcus sp. (strain AM4) TaxID=246969 RepID=UPI00018711D2|nr:CPBP family intramembrane glutamic endopeptidase [Thermococcus sp. AM4]EEB73481.1 CAAX amino terminal protease family protein [Thermococcus sp. AM4]
MIEFAVALLLWLLILAASTAVASLTAKKRARKAGFAMQLTMFLLSLAVIELIGGPGRFGFVPDFRYVPHALILGFGTSLILNLLEGNPSEPMPEFMPEGIERFVLLLIFAPLGEEVFTRGLIEGYLLSYGHFWSAILFSALLFALPHLMAFEGNRRRKAGIVTGAFILGSLAGYLFALGGITPAIALHSSANLAGLTVLKIKGKAED